MDQREDWWRVQERPFTSDKPLVGFLIVWLRGVWNSIATRWYVLEILKQQNDVNRRLTHEVEGLAAEIDRLREELSVVQVIEVDLDRELQEANRLHTGTAYSLIDELHRLRQKVTDLELASAGKDREP